MLYYFFTVPALALLAFLSYHHHNTTVILLSGLLPTYLLRFSIFGLPTNFLELAIVTIALIGFVQPAVRSRWAIAWHSLPFTLLALIALFVLAASISTYISPHPLTSLGILKSWIIIPILLGWLIYSGSFLKIALPAEAFGEGWENWKLKITNTLIASGAAVSVIGLFQIFTLTRIRSVYDVPNSLALFLAPLLVIALCQKRWLIATPITLALLATQSVSALMAVTITLLIGIIFWTNPSQKKLSLSILTLILLLSAVYLSSTGRLAYLTHPPNSISVRLQLWSISWELIKEHPILGLGLGTFEPAYQQKLHERFAQAQNTLPEFVFRDSHNWILSFWLNTGLLGLASFIAINVYVIWQTKRLLPIAYCLQPIVLALLALLLFGLTDTIFWKNDLAALHWILIALALSGSGRRSRRRSNNIRKLHQINRN